MNVTNIPRKWPKQLPELTEEQANIAHDFMKHWHEVLASSNRYKRLENFNHLYSFKQSKAPFLTTLEIGAGLGEHLEYEKLSDEQRRNYVALELRDSMAEKIRKRFPDIQVQVADCQKTIPFADDYFDRSIAIHVLEHLPNLPNTIKELHRVTNKQKGRLFVVIPCEGGLVYKLARKVSAQRVFEEKYQTAYKWFIEREHINEPHEIIDELKAYFRILHKEYFPFKLPILNVNLCIGLTLTPLISRK